MKVSVGIVCAVLGATIAFYLAVSSLVTLPADGTARWLAIAGISTLSLIAGVLINGISMQDYFKVSRAYNSLTSRLSPLLYSGIEDVLHRHARMLTPGGELNLSVSVLTGGLLRNAASTFPPGHSGEQQERKLGEGVQGFLAEAKVAGFAQTTRKSMSANRPVFDRFGKQIGEIPVSRNPATSGMWTFSRPIFERSTTTPWSKRIVGTLIVHSPADDGDSLFKTDEFHKAVDSVAIQVSPYLDAVQVLLGEEKL